MITLKNFIQKHNKKLLSAALLAFIVVVIAVDFYLNPDAVLFFMYLFFTAFASALLVGAIILVMLRM